MMTLVVTIRKEVENQAAGELLYEHISQWLQNNHPEVDYSGHLTNHLEGSEPPG